MKEHSLDTIDIELAVLLRRFTSMATKNTHHLDRSAYLLLNQILEHGPAGVKALAEEFQLDISTVSRQAAALEQKKYVYRIPDPLDRRAYSFQITDLGVKEYREYKQFRLHKIEDILTGWSEEERRLFGTLLRKFNRSFLNR